MNSRLMQVARQGRQWMAVALMTGLAAASPAAMAYQVGDTLDPEIAKTLALDPEKVTIVDFFASWCASCKKEIPLLDAMELDESRIELLGVCTDKDIDKGKAFQRKLNIEFRVHDDWTQDVVAAFAPFGMPALYFVHQNQVKKIHFGAMPAIDKIVQRDLERLLPEQ